MFAGFIMSTGVNGAPGYCAKGANVACCGDIAACCATSDCAAAACACWDGGLLRLGDVRAAVLAVVDALACPGGLRGQRVDDLVTLSVRCDKAMLAPRNAKADKLTLVATEMLRKCTKPMFLSPDDLDLVDEPKAAQLVAELLLRHVLVEPAEVDVAARVALANRKGDLRRDGGRLPPPDLELLPVQGELLDRRVGVERRGGRAVQEGEEDARLLGQHADTLERPEVHEVEQLVDGRRRGQVADVHRAPGGVRRGVHRRVQRDGRVPAAAALPRRHAHVQGRQPLLGEVLQGT